MYSIFDHYVALYYSIVHYIHLIISRIFRRDCGLHPALQGNEVQPLPQLAGHLAEKQETTRAYSCSASSHPRKSQVLVTT